MRLSKKAAAILLAAAVSALPMVVAPSPALASTTCEYLDGPTPSVEADTNGDGQADVRVPSLSDVSLCAQSDVFVHGEPLRLESCDWTAGCWRLYVHLQVGATVDTGLVLCRSIDGVRTCSSIDQTPFEVWTPDQPTMCIGFDVNGQYPCSGGTLLSFD